MTRKVTDKERIEYLEELVISANQRANLALESHAEAEAKLQVLRDAVRVVLLYGEDKE